MAGASSTAYQRGCTSNPRRVPAPSLVRPDRSGKHEDAPHRRQTRGELGPAQPRIIGREHTALGRPERDERTIGMGVQAIAVDIVVEPFWEPGAAPLQGAAGEISTVDGGVTISRAPGGGEEHRVATYGDRAGVPGMPALDPERP